MIKKQWINNVKITWLCFCQKIGLGLTQFNKRNFNAMGKSESQTPERCLNCQKWDRYWHVFSWSNCYIIKHSFSKYYWQNIRKLFVFQITNLDAAHLLLSYFLFSSKQSSNSSAFPWTILPNHTHLVVSKDGKRLWFKRFKNQLLWK